MKKIVIIGATGYVGSAILKEALGRGHQVKAIVRDPSKLTLIHPHLKVVGGNVTDTDFLSRELAKSDAVISAFNPGWSNPIFMKRHWKAMALSFVPFATPVCIVS